MGSFTSLHKAYVSMFTEETIILSKFTCELPSSPCLLISFLSVQKGLRTQILQPGHSGTTEKKRTRRVSHAWNIKTTLCPRFSSKTDFMQVKESRTTKENTCSGLDNAPMWKWCSTTQHRMQQVFWNVYLQSWRPSCEAFPSRRRLIPADRRRPKPGPSSGRQGPPAAVLRPVGLQTCVCVCICVLELMLVLPGDRPFPEPAAASNLLVRHKVKGGGDTGALVWGEWQWSSMVVDFGVVYRLTLCPLSVWLVLILWLTLFANFLPGVLVIFCLLLAGCWESVVLFPPEWWRL